MSYESSQAVLGFAQETTPGTAVLTPTIYIPSESPAAEDVIAQMLDTTLRANDSTVQNAYPGPASSKFGFSTWAYPVETGYLLRSMGLSDTITAGGATTLSASAAAGASAIANTAAVPANTVVVIDTGLLAEVNYVGTGGTALARPLQYAHASGATVTYLTKHLFKQTTYPQPQPPSYTIADLQLVRTRFYPGCKNSQLEIDVDVKGGIKVTPAFIGYPGQTGSSPTVAITATEPLAGYQWQAQAWGNSLVTRYDTAKYSLKRAGVEALPGSDGIQGPREVFAGDLSLDISVTEYFDNSADEDAFLAYAASPPPFTSIIASARTGAGLVITVSKPVVKSFKTDFSGPYVKASFDMAAPFNATDGGVCSIAVFNGQTAAYT